MLTTCDHPLIDKLENIIKLEDNPTKINRDGKILFVDYFRDHQKIQHLIRSSLTPSCYDYQLSTTWYGPLISFAKGEKIKRLDVSDSFFKEIFQEVLKNSTCFFTDGSWSPNSVFGSFAIVGGSDNVELEFRTSKIASIFTLEGMAIMEALKLILKSSQRKFVIFSDSRSVLEAL
ncbi:GSCOCG00012438001-RA-CDS, partial [Cotesia congregata]